MHSTQDRIQENANTGMARTQAALSRKFWLLTRTVDVEGADCLVQPRVRTRGEIHAGLVQAKYFEENTVVKIAAEYVDGPKSPFNDFFAMLHTDNCHGPESYFFTANEIHNIWQITSDGLYYSFTKAVRSKAVAQLGRSEDDIEDLILSGIQASDSSERVLRQFFDIYVDVRPVGVEAEYYLLKPHGSQVVLFKNLTSGFVRPIDPRRDLFNYSGDFSWGYEGTGVQFLATSLAAHYLRHAPSPREFKAILQYLAELHQDCEHTIEQQALARIFREP